MASFVATLQLYLDGVLAPQRLVDSILQLSVEESLHLPTMFTIVVRNAYLPANVEDEPWQFEPLFRFGQAIRINFGVMTEDDDNNFSTLEDSETLLIGEVTAIETHLTAEAQAPIIIRGYDHSHRLHRGRHCRSFQNMTDSDIVQKIAQEVQIPCGQIDETPGPYGYEDINQASGYVYQENQTNMEFLRSRAARHGFELFVENDKLHFRRPAPGESLSLTWLQEITSFRIRMTSAEQVSAVEIRGWDYSQKKAIVSRKELPKTSEQTQSRIAHRQIVTSTGKGLQADKPPHVLTSNEYGRGSPKSQLFNGLPKEPSVIVVDQPVFSEEEADLMAQSLADELEGQFIYADARASGNVRLRPGRIVELKDVNKYSGRYYITETRHLYEDGKYTTEFCVRGLRTGDVLSTLSPKQTLHPSQTHLVGIVTENHDPNGWGRVRVKFPTLSEDHNSYWARMVQVGAGASRGFDCLPEIGDEVLVAFEHGDIHRPYVLGGVWNGKDTPPEPVENSVVSDGSEAGTVRLRSFKSRVGHMMQLAEEDPTPQNTTPIDAQPGAELFGHDSLGSLKGVHLHTSQGHTLDLCDPDKAPMNCIRMQTPAKHHLSLSDAAEDSGIAFQTAIGQSVSLIDQSLPCAPQTTLNTPGDVVINAGAKAIPPLDLAAQPQFGLLGSSADNAASLQTYMSLLHNKISDGSRTVEISSGSINQLTLDGITLAAGPKTVTQVQPDYVLLAAPGVTISTTTRSMGVAPSPGMVELQATTIHINASTTVAITAPNIQLHGNVRVTGSLTVNGRSVHLGRLGA